MKKSFLPSRQKHKKQVGAVQVADLDALLTQKVSFRLFGEDHVIEPLTVEEFINFSKAYADILKLQEQEVVSPEELVAAYGRMIEIVCDTVKTEDVKKMTQSQVVALFSMLTDIHTGKLFADQKKSLEKVRMILGHSSMSEM